MPTLVTDRNPIARKATDRADISKGTCNCRAQALDALGELAQRTLALGIHDAEVWRGIGVLHAFLTGESTMHQAHVQGHGH